MTRSQQKMQVPGVKYRPAVQRGFRRGIDQLVRAIAPTLGPHPRHVVSQTMFQGQRPESLDNGAIIARRIVMLADRVEDVGAMVLREMLWKVYLTGGDGTATAAVLFDVIHRQGLTYIAAGGNAMRLRQCLDEAAQGLLDELDEMTWPLAGQQGLSRYAESLSHDADLAQVLAEAFDLLGADGRLEIRPGRNRKLVLELFDGLYWEGGLFTHSLAEGGPGRLSLNEPAFLVTDLEIQLPDELVPLLELACREGVPSLVLLASSISEPAQALLALPANRRRLQVAAVKTPSGNVPRPDYVEDLTRLVGGRPLLAAAGDRLEAVRPENLGHARRAWADKEKMGLEAGGGDPRQLRRHIAELRRALARANAPDDRKRLQQRLGQLIYGSGVLWVGATTRLQIEARQELATRTAEAIRGALREGVVPGGGVALLNLKPGLQAKARAAGDLEQRVAHKILAQAVEAPLRTLLANSGCRPEQVLADLAQLPAGHGFDVTRGEIKDMHAAGIVDSAAVVKAALRNAIHSASLALTIDVLIQRANPPLGILPQ